MYKIILSLLMSLFVLSISAFAQNDEYNPDPETPKDNECFIGGVMEGKCHTTDIDKNGSVEDWEIKWHWECGWYLARFNNDVFSSADVPLTCHSLLPEPAREEEASTNKVYISFISVGTGKPCDTKLQLTLAGNKPMDVIIYVYNASYDNTFGDDYPATLQPGVQTHIVTFGGVGNPDYFFHTVHVRDMNGKLISNYIGAECN